jgi:hypothetical protein
VSVNQHIQRAFKNVLGDFFDPAHPTGQLIHMIHPVARPLAVWVLFQVPMHLSVDVLRLGVDLPPAFLAVLAVKRFDVHGR